MKLRFAGVLWFMVACGCLAFGQHNTDNAKPGSSLPRDTWTGTVTSLDHDTGSLTIEHAHKGKAETFTGILRPPIQVMDQYGSPVKPPIQIQTGARLIVHYIAQGAKYSTNDGGTRQEQVAKENLIVRIDFLPAK